MKAVYSRSSRALAFFATAVLGALGSLGLYQAWNLEPRWTVVVFVGIAAVAISMCFARKFSDFLLIIMFFSIPFSSFTKWLLIGDGFEFQGTLIGTLGIGVLDFLLVGLYMAWFYRIFVVRQENIPRIGLLDVLVLAYIIAYFLASIDSAKSAAAFGATEYLIKHALFYFYVSRHLKERHLPWLLAAFAFTIFIQAGLGSYQFLTGKLVGLALDRGAGGSQVNTEYDVPGLDITRATGTSYDSHMLGDYIGALLPFALVLLFTPRLRPVLKLACLAVSAGAVLVVVISLSRTAWITTAAVLPIGIVLIISVWRERQVVPAVAGLVLVAALVSPFIAPFVSERFSKSPEETITTRFDQFEIAWHIFTLYPIFGVGPANYIQALKHNDYLGMVALQPDTGQIAEDLLPVHNGILLHAAEVGLLGLLAYLCVVVNAAWRLFVLLCARRDLAGRLALAALLGLMTIELNDQFIVGLHNPDVFMTFWLLVALAVALPRMALGAGEVLMSSPQRTGRAPGRNALATGNSS